MKQTIIKSIERSDIKEISLLSLSEYERYKDSIPVAVTSWWILGKDKDDYVAHSVYTNGYSNDRLDTFDLYDGVRPVIIVKTAAFCIGELVLCGKFLFTAIDRNLLICNDVFDTLPFDRHDTKYKKEAKKNGMWVDKLRPYWGSSYLKAFLESDDFKSALGI